MSILSSRANSEVAQSAAANAPRLAPDGNIAEAEDYAPAGGEAAKAHLGSETRKQKYQVQLPADCVGIGPGKNSVTHGLALRVHGSFHKQRVRSRMPGLFQPSDRERRQGLQTCRLQQIRRRIRRIRTQRRA